MENKHMERKYYEVSESLARTANNMNSMRDYKPGRATEEYRSYCDKVYDIVAEIAEKKPNLLEKAQRMADRYCRKLADYYNAYYRNEASCPSILISGVGNFPVKKKNKQNSRRESLMEEWNYLDDYARKIRNMVTMEMPILSNDENAIELLTDKLEKLEAAQELMKKVNAYYRKNKTLDGCEELTPEQIEKLKVDMSSNWHYEDKPFATYELTNNNANIRNTRERLENLKKVKEQGNQETENQFFKVVENTDIMRLQLFFDGKPEPEVREVLKNNGFKWAPSQNAWQRQLTNNAKYALECVISKLESMNA